MEIVGHLLGRFLRDVRDLRDKRDSKENPLTLLQTRDSVDSTDRKDAPAWLNLARKRTLTTGLGLRV